MVSGFCQLKKLKKVFGAVFLCERGSIFGGGKELFLGRLWTAKCVKENEIPLCTALLANC